MDILDEATAVIRATTQTAHIEQITAMMDEAAEYTFLFLMASPGPHGGTMVRELTDASIPGAWFMLNAAAAYLMGSGQADESDNA